MWPTQAGSGGGGYYYPTGWPAQTGYNVNTAATQQTDPSDWAAKAAQWAQHKQVETQYLQQMSHWQQQHQYPQQQQQQQYNPMQQHTQPQVHSQYPQQTHQQQQVHQQAPPVHQPQQQQQYAGMGSAAASNSGVVSRQPQVYSQPSTSQSTAPPALIQAVKSSAYPQQTQSPPVPLIADKTQPKPLFPLVQSQQQQQRQQQGNQFQQSSSTPSQSAPATSAAPSDTGPGSLLPEPSRSMTNTIRPLFDSNRPKFATRNFQGHGFQKTVPSGRGFHRGGGGGGGPRPGPPRPQGRGSSPSVWNEQQREGYHSGSRPPPTEETFGDLCRNEGPYSQQSGAGGHCNVEASPHQFDNKDKVQAGMHGQERNDHSSRWSEGGHQLEEQHHPGENRDRFDRREPLHRLQDDWSAIKREEHPSDWERRGETDQNFEQPPPHRASPFDQQAQYEKEEHDLYQSDQDSQTSSRERNQLDSSFNTDPTSRDYGRDVMSGQKGSPSLSTVSSHRSDEPTISSLRKDTSAVIPGLGEFDSKGDNTSESVGREFSSDDRGEKMSSEDPLGGGGGGGQVNIGGGQATEMIESLGKIVSQLQTLKGLTSSLQLLKALPKATQEEEEMRMKEKVISEEAKRKVAALLANESDSDGEQGPTRNVPHGDSDQFPRRMTDSYGDNSQYHRDLPSGTTGGPSPPAREFDGTYNVKPQVYNTYSNEDDHRQGDLDRRDDYRDNPQYYYQSRSEHDYPPHQSRGPPQDYYPPPIQGDTREREYGGPESRYNPEMEQEYDRQRAPAPQYDQRGGYDEPPGGGGPTPLARDYPPEHYRRPLGEYDQQPPPPSMGGRGRESGQQYYDQPPHPEPAPSVPRERERPPVLPESDYSTHGNIASKMQTIDYSHGSGMHTVDYNHGAASSGSVQPAAQPFRERPRMGEADYPREFPSYGGPGQYPAYPYPVPGGAFPPAPGMYASMSAGGYLPPGLDPATLFAAYAQAGESKRKALPLWLREELEKMERKKQKQLAKEAEEALRRGEESEGRPKWRDELNSDDDDDDEDEDEEEEDRRKKKRRERKESPVSERKSRSHRSYRHSRSKSPGRSESPSPTPQRKRRREELPVEDEEDKQISMIMKVRKMLTEILLDVTDQEIEATAKEAFEEAKKPKLAFSMKQQMAITQSKENILAGLSMYASESESEEEPADRHKSSSSRSKKSRFSNDPPPSSTMTTMTAITVKSEFKSPKEPKTHRHKESSKSHSSSSKSKNEETASSSSSSKHSSSSSSSSSSKSKHSSNSGSSSSSSDKEKKDKKKEKSHKDTKGSGSGGSSSSSTKKKSSSSDRDGRDKEKGKESPSTSKRHSSSSSKSDRNRSPSPSPTPRKSSSSSSKHKSSSTSSSRARSRSRSRSPSKSSKSSTSKSTSSGSKGTPSSSSSSSSRKRSDSFTTPSRSKRSPSPPLSSAVYNKRSRYQSRSRSRSHSPLGKKTPTSQRRSSSSAKNKSPPPRSKPVTTYRVVQIKE